MPRVTFTRNLQRHVAAQPMSVAGRTVREALEAAFHAYPRARGYVLDEHGAVRPHMAVFVDGRPIADRTRQSDSVPADGEVFVMQALSGG